MQDGPKRILIFVTVIAGVIGFLTYGESGPYGKLAGYSTGGAMLSGIFYAAAAYAVARGLFWIWQGFAKR